MELTKNQFVLKALVEEMLRRRFNGEKSAKADIETGIKVFNAITPQKIYVSSTSDRFVEDFTRCIRRQRKDVIAICHADAARNALIGIEAPHIVQLHTGMLTIAQSAIRKDIMQMINVYARKAVIWHIGDWRA